MHAIAQDPALDALLHRLTDQYSLIDQLRDTHNAHNGCNPIRSLLVLDEQPLVASQLQRLQPINGLDIICNRYEQVEAAKQYGLNAAFNDFEFPTKSYDLITYRLSKEKAIVHHLIKQAGRHLSSNGKLLLSGYKQEGIKTAIRCAELYLGSQATIQKSKKQLSLADITLSQLNEEKSPTLADSYPLMQPLEADINGYQPSSKPGQFGWKQLDLGSQILIRQLHRLQSPESVLTNAIDGANNHTKKRLITRKTKLLDLGCGYGYLALNALQYRPKSVTLTDNCAAAIASAQFNIDNYFQQMKLDANTDVISTEVIATDAADQIKQSFDVILCNPPFHLGFKVMPQLTQRFLQATRRLLTSSGLALFVVNEFIGIEAVAAQHRLNWQLLCKESGFKVGLISKIPKSTN